MKTRLLKLTLLLTALAGATTTLAQGTAFTYQGRLSDGGAPASGLYDLRFTLYDALESGNAVAGTNTLPSVPVTNGLFTVTLDFGSVAWSGAPRWLDIAVRTNGSPDPHLPLTPRQPILPTPYAIRAGNAALLSGQGTNAFAPATGSPEYVRKAGDTMTGPLNLPLNGLVTGIKQLVVADGNVGIGNPSPTRTLHAGSATDAGASGHVRIAVDSPTENDPGFEWLTSGSLNWLLYRPANSSDLRFYEPTAGDRVTFKANGNVGIGTANPIARLHVEGNGVEQWGTATFSTPSKGAGNSHVHFGPAGDWYIRSASPTGKVVIQDSGGNVGIGTANPGASLDVLGWMRVNSSGPPFPDRLGLELGVHNGSPPTYSWIQSHELRPLALNPMGSDVGIGTATPQGALHVLHPSRPDAIVFSKATADAPRMMLGQGPGGNGDEVHFLSSSKTGSGSFLPMTLWTGDRERMRIDANGSVGIGTTSPNLGGDTRELTVSAGTSGEGIARLNVQGTRLTDDIYGALDFYHQANNTASIASYRSGADNAGNLTFWTRTTGMTLAERMRIDNNGNVGIGTTTPSVKLHMIGDQAYIQGTANLAALDVNQGGSGPAALFRGGNVGIGTTSPQTSLHLSSLESRLRLQSSGSQAFAVTEYTTDARIWHTGVGGSLVGNGLANKYYIYDETAGQTRMVVDGGGNVGIGTKTPNWKFIVENGETDGNLRPVAALRDSTVSGHEIMFRVGTGQSDILATFEGAGVNQDLTFTTTRADSTQTEKMRITSAGNVGIGTTTPTATLEVVGDIKCTGAGKSITTPVLTITGGSDVAEPFQMAGADIPKGAVVVIDDEQPGQLKLSERAYDTRVAGIVSGAGGVQPGITLSQQGVLEGGQNVALSGRVYVQADATESPIKPGDLLTTATTPGHAMKVRDHTQAQGAILGKAMSALTEGKGLVLVLVTLQ